MRTTIRPIVPTLLALATALLFITGSGRLHAQRWQYEYGGATSIETGGKGVTPVSTGGYVAVGSSHGSTTRDAYVVKTNDDGSLAWSYTYSVENTHTGAICIRECANGDFIVVGSTQAQSSCCCNPSNIFLMRLKSDGSVIWVKSYGSAWTESGASVIETKYGNGDGTSPGDFVVTGSVTLSDGTSRGYMLRTTAGGKMIWDRTFAARYAPFNQVRLYASQGFSDLRESEADGGRYIWTVGTVRMNSSSIYRGILYRVGAHDGTVTLNPGIWDAYGASTFGNSLTELTKPANLAGQIAVTGTIDRGTGQWNAYLALFNPANPTLCPPTLRNYLDAMVHGGTPYSVGNDIHETSNGVIIAGTAQPTTGGLGSTDLMLLEIDPSSFFTAGIGLNVYGFSGADLGASAMEVAGSSTRTAGFVAAGTTASANQLYLIKTNSGGDAAPGLPCTTSIIGDGPVTPTSLNADCPVYVLDSIRQFCSPPWTADPRTWETELCYSVTRAARGEEPNEGVSAVQPADLSIGTVIPVSDDASVAGYPNPVRKGSAFTLEYALAHAGHVTIDVVDIAGKTVYTSASDYPAGTSRIPVSTEGWPSGTYVLKLSREGATAVQRITVLDK